MAGEHDGGALGPPHDRGADQLGGVLIEMSGRFVEHQQAGTGVHPRQCASHRQAPQFTRAELGGGCPGDAREPDLGEGGRGVRAVQRQFLTRGGREHSRGLGRPPHEVRRDPRDPPLHGRVVRQRPDERREERGFAGPAGTGDGDDAAQLGVEPGDRRGPTTGVPDLERGHADRGVVVASRVGSGRGHAGHGVVVASRVGSERRVEVLASPAQRGETILGGVERHPHATQDGKALGGEQQREQRGLQVHGPVEQAQTQKYRHHRHGERRDELQRQGGQERPSQRLPGAAAVDPLDAGQRIRLLLDATEPDQDGQPARQLCQMVGQPGQRTQGRVRPLAGVPPDQDHEQRHQRDRQHDHQRADPVGGEDADQEQRWHHECRDDGGHRLDVVLVQVVHPLGREHRGPAARVARPGHPAPQPAPELLLDGGGGPAGSDLGPPFGCGPQQRTAQTEDQDRPHRPGGQGARRQSGDAPRHGLGHQHQPQRAQCRQHPQGHEHGPGRRPGIRTFGCLLRGPLGLERPGVDPVGGPRRRPAHHHPHTSSPAGSPQVLNGSADRILHAVETTGRAAAHGNRPRGSPSQRLRLTWACVQLASVRRPRGRARGD